MLSNVLQEHQLENDDWHQESARDGMCLSFVCDYRKRGSGRDAAHVVVVASQHHVAVDSPTGTPAKNKYTNNNIN